MPPPYAGFSRSASIGRDESLPGMPVRARAMYNLLELLEGVFGWA